MKWRGSGGDRVGMNRVKKIKAAEVEREGMEKRGEKGVRKAKRQNKKADEGRSEQQKGGGVEGGGDKLVLN